MISPCDTCKYRQRTLDPEGCFHQQGSTGFVGRIIKAITGCERYAKE